MTAGSLFAGVGGFDLGFHRAGFDVRWQVEIDSDARNVLARHWPDTARHTDINAYAYGRAKNRQRHGLMLPAVDAIFGGFPCQDVSVAGRRKGLKGARSGLFFAFMRIVSFLKPQIVVIENVPGLLSSHDGRDFATVLDALAERGYGWAFRVLDSRYFGVAQRRRRVFIVGCLGDAFDRAAAILFESTGGERDSAPGDEARTDIAATLRGRSHGAGVNMPGRGGEDDENIVAFNWQSGGDCRIGNFSDTTDALHSGQTPAVFGVHANQRGELRTSDLAGSLSGSRSGKQFEGVFATLNSDGNDGGFRTEPGEHLVAHCLTGSMHKRHDEDTDTLIPRGGVRRLTPLECERLQGFPDGWTCLCGEGHRGSNFCDCPDSPRYRQLGNAVTVTVAQWIAERIKAAEGVAA